MNVINIDIPVATLSAEQIGRMFGTLVERIAYLQARVAQLEAAADLPSMRDDDQHPGTPEGRARFEGLQPDIERVAKAVVEDLKEALKVPK